MGHGRVGSFFPPSEWEGTKPLKFARGARLFEVFDGTTIEGIRENKLEGGSWTLRTCILQLAHGAVWSKDNTLSGTPLLGTWIGDVVSSEWVTQRVLDTQLPEANQWANALLAFVVFALIPVGWILLKKGGRSKKFEV